MITSATNMVYTSVYLDLKGEDALVLNTPYFESEVPSIIALKSYRLEGVEGCVIGAPLSVMQQLEGKLKKFEETNPKLTIEQLLKFFESQGVSVRYVQSPSHPRAPRTSKQITITKEGKDDSSHQSGGEEGV